MRAYIETIVREPSYNGWKGNCKINVASHHVASSNSKRYVAVIRQVVIERS